MANAHMVIDGKVRVVTFDRVSEMDKALIIRPTGDHVAGPSDDGSGGQYPLVHPGKPGATTFDVIVSSLDPGQDPYLIQPVDPLGGKKRKDGTIVAPLMSFKDSMDHYPPSR